jgi:hypothetical protein
MGQEVMRSFGVRQKNFSNGAKSLDGFVPVVEMFSGTHGLDVIVCSVGASEEEAESVARLVNAAPQLLEALKAFAARAQQLNNMDTGPLGLALAAIAKAEGK